MSSRRFWKATVKLADRVAHRDIPRVDGRPQVLHLHIRKTAGTSFNLAFLSQMTPDAEAVYERTARKLFKSTQTEIGRYCAWDPALAESGRYLFCHTHFPLWQFKVPDDAFVLTILRDPLARLSSLHAMLCHLFDEQSDHRGLPSQSKFFKHDLIEFLEGLPDEQLLGQLYDFSRRLDFNEAVKNLKERVNLVGKTEQYGHFVERFNATTGYNLPILHVREGTRTAISYDALPASLSEKLAAEREFVETVVL